MVIQAENKMEVQVINKSGFDLPKYQTSNSAGVDIRACFDNGINENFIFGDYRYWNGILELDPGARALIPTGIYTAIPNGYEVQIRPRSGLALKHGVTVLNTPGTIDADYRNEWGIILINNGNKTFTINNGDRIAQAVLSKVTQIKWNEVESIDDTERKGGFGHTGTK